MTGTPRHGLSFDVEEAFHALNMWGATPTGTWALRARL